MLTRSLERGREHRREIVHNQALEAGLAWFRDLIANLLQARGERS